MSKVVVDRVPRTSDLLHIYSFNQGNTKKAHPLMMEFKVNPETSPFLISSARSVMWVNAHDQKVRAAFRPIEPAQFFLEVVEEVARMGEDASWGNVHPLTAAGIQAAIAHILSYDLPSPEILAHPDAMFDFTGDLFLGCRIQRADWLDPGMVLVVPQDRDFVGFILMAGDAGLSVVHNASRGIAVCRGTG